METKELTFITEQRNVQAEILSKLDFEGLSKTIKIFPSLQINEELWLDIVTIHNLDVSNKSVMTYYNIYIQYLMQKKKIYTAEIEMINGYPSYKLLLAKTYDEIICKLAKFLFKDVQYEHSEFMWNKFDYDKIMKRDLFNYLSFHGYDKEYFLKREKGTGIHYNYRIPKEEKLKIIPLIEKYIGDNLRNDGYIYIIGDGDFSIFINEKSFY